MSIYQPLENLSDDLKAQLLALLAEFLYKKHVNFAGNMSGGIQSPLNFYYQVLRREAKFSTDLANTEDTYILTVTDSDLFISTVHAGSAILMKVLVDQALKIIKDGAEWSLLEEKYEKEIKRRQNRDEYMTFKESEKMEEDEEKEIKLWLNGGLSL